MKHYSIVTAAVLALSSTIAGAATISLTPSSTDIQLGASLSVDLYMDFSDEATLGGGVDVSYDGGILDFTSFLFDAAFLTVTDSSFTCPGAAGCTPSIDQTNVVSNIAFGNFSGISGPYFVGTIAFDTLTAGTVNFATSVTAGSGGPFVSAVTNQVQSVSFTGATVNVNAVPLPAAGWLMLSGIGLLLTQGLRKSTK